jgi:hypothetical protein
MVHCPAHHDRTPSLSISEGEGGKPLMFCHAGCTSTQICVADILTQVLWHSAHAKVLAHRGDLVGAEMHVGVAVALAHQTDASELRGDALLDLAEVLSLSDKPAVSRAAAEEALRVYEDKEHLVGAKRALLMLTPPVRGETDAS